MAHPPGRPPERRAPRPGGGGDRVAPPDLPRRLTEGLTRDELRALGFVALLLALAAGVRLADSPAAIDADAPAVAVAELEMESRAALEAERRRRTPLASGEMLDPNTAHPDDLARLPGIGPATAARIVEERERAPFARAEDLLRVPGIGPRSLERIGAHVAVGARPGSGPGSGPATGSGSAVLPPSASAAGGRVGSESETVPINHASAAELEALPGIGPALARRIVAHRDSAGPFRRLEDLVEVRGIGPATLARLVERVRLTP